ncbi:MAG: tetratricopeptide repeat protein [Balneolales bacterium]|nr:tetratricopeptide repeat protein [Balneolales bacterium]
MMKSLANMTVKWALAFLILFSASAQLLHAQQNEIPGEEEARALFDQENHEEALKAYRLIYQDNPDNYEARFRVGLLLGWTGRYKEARNHLRTMHEDMPDDLDVSFALIRVLSWNSEFRRAHHYIDKVLAEEPSNETARALKAQVYLWQGRVNRAWLTSGELLQITPDNELALQTRTAIHTTAAPSLESFYARPWDSDRTHIHTIGQIARIGVHPGTDVSFRWSYTQSESRTAQISRSTTALSAAVAHQIDARWLLRGGLGASLYPDGDGAFTGFSAGFSTQYRFRNLTTNAFYNRYGLADTPTLINNRIFINELGLSSVWERNAHSIFGRVEYAFLSDDNARVDFLTEYGYTIDLNSFAYRPGIRFNYRSFERTILGQGYFSPEWLTYGTFAQQLSWNPTETQFYGRIAAELGVQQFQVHLQDANDPTFRYQLEAMAGYRFNEFWEVETMYTYSNLINLNTASADDSFWYNMIRVTIRIRFEPYRNPFVRL